jgi:hypothetical protein
VEVVTIIKTSPINKKVYWIGKGQLGESKTAQQLKPTSLRRTSLRCGFPHYGIIEKLAGGTEPIEKGAIAYLNLIFNFPIPSVLKSH